MMTKFFGVFMRHKASMCSKSMGLVRADTVSFYNFVISLLYFPEYNKLICTIYFLEVNDQVDVLTRKQFPGLVFLKLQVYFLDMS